MRKFLVIVALLLFIAPFAYAGNKVLEMHDSTNSVINTGAIQIMKQNSVNECLRYGGGKACYMN